MKQPMCGWGCRVGAVQLFALLCVLPTSVFAAGTWQKQDGPYGGTVNALVRGAGTQELFVGTGDGLRFSSDNGATWTTPAQTGLTCKEIMCLAVSPVNGWLWAGTMDGVFFSSDKGNSWQVSIAGLIVAATNRYNIWGLCFRSNGDLFAAENFTINILPSGGNTWSKFGSPPLSGGVYLTVDQNDTLYTGAGGGVSYITKGSTTWQATPALPNSSVTAICVDSNNTLYAACGFIPTTGRSGGIWHLPSGKTAWINSNLTTSYTDSMAVFASGTTIYAGGTMNGVSNLYVSKDQGNTFTSLTSGLTNIGHLKALFAEGSSDIYFGSYGVYHSSDNGSTWSSTSPMTNGLKIPIGAKGLYAFDSRGLARASNGDLYVGGEGGIAKTSDGGATWTTVNGGLNTLEIFKLGTNSIGEILAVDMMNHYGYRLIGNGSTWTKAAGLSADSFASYFILDKNNNVVISTAYNDNVWRSTDNGTTYTQIGKAPTTPFTLAIAPDGTIFMGTESGNPCIMYSSTDGGVTWNSAGTVADNDIYEMTVNKAGEVFAGGRLVGISRYTGSSTWVTSNAGLPGATGPNPSIKIMGLGVDANGNMLAGVYTRYALNQNNTHDGIFISYDNGRNWTLFNTGITDTYADANRFEYDGQGNLFALTCAGVYKLVNGLPTTTTVTSSQSPSIYGQSVTFTATVTGTGAPTGTVTFMDGSTTLGTGTLNTGGVATFSTSALTGGSHSITGVYSGDTNFSSSTSATLTQTVNKAATTNTVASSLNPSTFTQSVTFTVTVSGTSATGTVTFKDGATTLGTGTLSSGVASFSTSTLSVATHSITAVYSGDANFSGCTSSVLTQVVNKAATTNTVASSTNPSTVGQSVTFTATVSGTGATGTVTFKDGGSTLGTGTLSGGTAIFSISTLSVSSHSITAVYSGDANFSGSTSSVLTQVVNKAATTTTVVSSLNPSTFGQSVTFTAAVSGTGATGTVTFKDGGSTLGTGTLSGGTAIFSISTLSVSSHSITAVYSGDANFSGSTSSVLTQVVNKAATTNTVVSSLNPSIFGQSVTFTATVSGTGSTRTVTFMDGASTLGTGTLSGGTATFSISTLSVSSHSITAVYSGDANFLGSTSAVLTQVVNIGAPPVITSGPTATPNPAGVGQTVIFIVSASAPNSDPITYAWTFGDGGSGSGTAPSYAYTSSGVYTATVTVTDTITSLTATGNIAVTIVAPPVVNSPLTASGTVGTPFSYTITATNNPTSYSAAGLPAGLSINASTGVISGTPTTAATSTVIIGAANAGGTGSAALALTVNPVNQPPVITAAASATPNPAVVAASVSFTVGASDADGDVLTYSWTFGDGTTGTGATVSHAYSASGTFTATVTVSDGQATVTSSVVVTVNSTASDPSLVGYWNFDEGSGTIAADTSGNNNNNGTLINAPAWTTGKFLGALNFNGVNSYVSVPDAPSLNPGQFTLSAWVNSRTPSSATPQEIIAKDDDIHTEYNLRIISGKIYLGANGITSIHGSTTIAANTWYLATGTYDGTTLKIYVNGALDATLTKTLPATVDNGLSVTIGARTKASSPFVFNGILDDVRIYNRALSQAEVQTLANATAGGRALSLANENASAQLTIKSLHAATQPKLQGKDSATVTGTIGGIQPRVLTNRTAAIPISPESRDDAPSAGARGTSGQTVAVSVAGALRTFTLDKSGRGRSANGTIGLKLKPAKAGATAGSIAFSLKIQRGSWSDAWSITNSAITPVTVGIVIGGDAYNSIANVSSSAKRGAIELRFVP